ncbi:MAG: branched-chain amino acid ABC transporter permease [Gammaproteobacteria bacterium]|nr:branched-chain amino acid ABC transporter permease [Gammaproteobacteria bacterium]
MNRPAERPADRGVPAPPGPLAHGAKKAAPWLLGVALLSVLPFFLKYHQQDFMIFLLINVLVVASYRLMTLTGEWSLIHVVLWGVGAYASGLATKHFDLSFWLAMPLAGLTAAMIAGLLSFPLFRMTQFYFLIGSFAAGEAIRLTWKFFNVPFGGPKGIKYIPAPEVPLPGGGFEIVNAIPYYFLTLAVVAASLFVLYRIEHSRIGLTLHSIHWRAPLAESVGINTWRYRALAFMIASFFAGIAGSLFVHYLGSANPNQFGIASMVFVLVWVIVGGTRTFYGPIVGVTVLSILNEFFREADELRPAIYGAVLIAAMLFLPDGLESLPGRVRAFFKGRRLQAGESA